VKPRPCIAMHANRLMLRPFLQHIEAFFSQEIREISCKTIFDSERALVPLRWLKLDVASTKILAASESGRNCKTVAPGRPVTRKSAWAPPTSAVADGGLYRCFKKRIFVMVAHLAFVWGPSAIVHVVALSNGMAAPTCLLLKRRISKQREQPGYDRPKQTTPLAV
jgi:hypothetical protein